MPLDNPDRQEFIDAFAKEIIAIKSMSTWNTNGVIPQSIDKKLLGTSKFVYTKTNHPDGSFDKNKARLVFRDDIRYI